MDDVYQAMLAALGGDAVPGEELVMGKVTSTEPLKVLVGGNTMERGELLCNAGIITGAMVGGAWAAGEQLLMLPIEEAQRYVIICKVVEL